MYFDGILFDLDGTLWDATAHTCRSWQTALDRHPELSLTVTPELLRASMGMLIADIGAKYFPRLPAHERARIMSECCAQEQEDLGLTGGILFPGLEETLALLAAQCPLFIVSNCEDGYIPCFFRAHGLRRFFRDYECPGRTGLPKGENIRLVVARNGLRRPVYIGDTQGDCDAAALAGVPFLHAAYGFGVVDKAVPSVRAFSDIPAALAAMSPP